MVLGVVFAIFNVFTVIVLLGRRYWRLYPCFCVAQACTAWQALIRIAIPAADRAAWMKLWAPGEWLLLLATSAAVTEAVWRSVEQMRHRWRLVMMAGLIVFVAGLVWAVHTDVTGDWYAQFLNHRVWLMLGLAILAFSGFWFGMGANRVWPRVARMHMGLYAVLMVGHISFGDWGFWQWANTHYRWLEMACCFGWVINSDFLAREFAAIATLQTFRGGARRSLSAFPSRTLRDGQTVFPGR